MPDFNSARLRDLLHAGYSSTAAVAVLGLEACENDLLDAQDDGLTAQQQDQLRDVQITLNAYEWRLIQGAFAAVQHEAPAQAAGQAEAPGALRSVPAGEGARSQPASEFYAHALGREHQRQTAKKWDETAKGARDGVRHRAIRQITGGRTDSIKNLPAQHLRALVAMLEGALGDVAGFDFGAWHQAYEERQAETRRKAA